MSTRRPEVFISATSADLRTTREIVRDALLAIDCHPILQEHFGPDARTVREMIRERIARSDAVIHLAGRCYGAEPARPEPGHRRRSYTQLEYDLAAELHKPIYIFILGDRFPYDAHEPEEEEKARLQQQHRSALERGERLYQLIDELPEFEKRLRELRIAPAESAQPAPPKRGLAVQFRGCSMSLAVSLTLGLAVVAGVWLHDPGALRGTHDLEHPRPDNAPSAAPTPPPTVVDALPPPPAKADNTLVSEDVRAEVLKRIDALPGISPVQKDRLYNSVRRAREMRRVVVVSFGSGQQTLPASEKENVKNLLNSAEVMKFRDDLTAVFVVLGFADAKGDEKSNLAISGARGKSVKDFMANVCGVKNVTHDVAMGGAKLIIEQKFAKNRIVEIWVVIP